ncbi:hypothetical protein FRC16_000346 [Serendipita sp. 398]|nr:hypothetical protein FRC16_000346 [Serendipita sp. 398]
MGNLATIIYDLGQLEDAEKMEREVLALRREILGPRHPTTLLSMASLAITLKDNDQLEEAENMMQEVVTLQREILGPRHRDTVSAQKELSLIRRQRKQSIRSTRKRLDGYTRARVRSVKT